jgi:outer membrane biogenesis lipoprotein LolB
MKHIIAILAIVMLTGCATMQPTTEPDTAVAEQKELISTRFFAIGKDINSKDVFLRLYWDKATGQVYMAPKIQDKYWDDPPKKADVPVEGE